MGNLLNGGRPATMARNRPDRFDRMQDAGDHRFGQGASGAGAAEMMGTEVEISGITLDLTAGEVSAGLVR